MVTRSQLTSMGVAFAGGVVAAFLYSQATAKPPVIEIVAPIASPVVAENEVATVRAGYERKLADLGKELAAAKASEAEAVKGPPFPGLRREDLMKRIEERLTADRAAAREQDNARLLAAGYSQERIDFIKKRATELRADFRRKSDLLRQQGKPDLDAELARNIDSDIDLHRELGAEEYARYRQALGRSIGTKIGEVLPGGAGESAGLKVGDQVLSYDGVRVFNIGELSTVLQQHTNSRAPVSVDVLRNGQKIRVTMAAGSSMGVRSGDVPGVSRIF